MVFETIATLMATKGLETLASEAVKVLVDTHIKPLFKKEFGRSVNKEAIEECIHEYLEITYKKAMIMNTIVFRGIDKTLCDLYTPLTIVEKGQEESKVSICINDGCLEEFMKFDKILIVDTAGMGKSTITKFLIVKYIIDNKKIPILMELRKLKDDQEILDYIMDQFNLLGKNIDKECIISMLRQGDFVIFLDGYDEVSNELKGKVMEEIQDFFLKAGNNQYVITSREETDLVALGDFKRFSIKPLSMEEAFELIGRYDQNGELSKKLIRRIKSDKQLAVLKEFLTNAMLTSLLYKTFQYKEEIAYKKLDFYSQVYEALFNDHDKTKGGAYVHEKRCFLDSTDFERLLRRIAFFSLKENKLEYQSKSDFQEIIQMAIKQMPWLDVRVDYVLYDITHAVPFFQKDGNSYKWVHKSFMEYFSAGYVCYESNSTEKLLEKMSLSSNFSYYTNVLDFCSEMKPELFRKVVIYPFLCEYVVHYEKTYLNFGDYEQYYMDILKTASYVSKIKIHLYENEEVCEKTFRSGKDVWFNPDDIGIVNMAIHCSNERGILALSAKRNMDIFEFLNHKNIDVFSENHIENERNYKYDYTGADVKMYIIDDDIEQWYNSKSNYKKITLDWFEGINNLRDRKVKCLSYEKCLRLRNRIATEIHVQKQIEDDLDLN